MEEQTKTPIANDASKGLVTSRDPSTLAPGELTVAESVEYRVGSHDLYKLPGRSSTGAALGGPVLAITKLQYDTADDVLIADANGNISESVADTSPTFSTTPVTGLSKTAVPQYTGFKNEWIRCNGVDDNMLRESGAVPNGTQGNWRPVGMPVALMPSLSSITHYTGGGQTLRPTTFTNQTFLPQQGLVPYHDPSLAFDGPGVGTGTVSGAAGQTVVTGVGTFFTTQLSIGAILTFSTGEQGVVLSITSATSLTLENNLVTALSAATFTYTNATTSVDPMDTRAWATTGDSDHVHSGTSSPIFPRTATCTWKFTTSLIATNRVLSVRHNGACSPPDQGPNFGPTGMTFQIEYSQNGGSTWTNLGQVRHQPFTSILEDSFVLPDSLELANNLWIRATISATTFQTISGHWLDISHAIYDIKVSTGSSGVYYASNPIYYGITEVYTDSDGVEHQSNMGTQVGPGGSLGGLFISAADLQAATSVTLNLPAAINPLSTKFIIWRSVDTPGGGFPVMYAVGTANVTDTQWTDTFNVRPDDTGAIAALEQYKILEILYPDGTSSLASYYSQPPLSFMTLAFQGCLVYFPADDVNARRIFYSLPATISNNSLEQVPEQYYLDFQTPKNDQVKSGAVTNGGRSMLAFFENYTMLVNFLPQGSDPGGFNNTVKESVSDKRGCAGRLACTEFTLPAGQTLVASVDALGLWVTNGVNLVEEWSNDINWDTLIADITLEDVILVDKPHKRRIEMLYVDGDGNNQEYHFFYGRMKQGIDGKMLPLVSGPHVSGIRSKHYTMIDGKWKGFSGDSSNTGDVFLEDSQASDDSHGYDVSGSVPTIWESGDIYVGGIHKAHITEAANIRFSDSPTKDITMIGTFIRDAGATEVITKTIAGDANAFPKQIYWHRYADRHRIKFTDISNTAMPSFISYVIETRSAGGTRDL